MLVRALSLVEMAMVWYAPYLYESYMGFACLMNDISLKLCKWHFWCFSINFCYEQKLVITCFVFRILLTQFGRQKSIRKSSVIHPFRFIERQFVLWKDDAYFYRVKIHELCISQVMWVFFLVIRELKVVYYHMKGRMRGCGGSECRFWHSEI